MGGPVLRGGQAVDSPGVSTERSAGLSTLVAQHPLPILDYFQLAEPGEPVDLTEIHTTTPVVRGTLDSLECRLLWSQWEKGVPNADFAECRHGCGHPMTNPPPRLVTAFPAGFVVVACWACR